MRIYFWLFVLILGTIQPLFAQNKLDNFDIQGHRGARGWMPENTIPAMFKAIELGVTTLELDVVITGDRQVLVSHEAWINADICLDSNGQNLSNSQGKQRNLYTLRYDDITAYDCGSKTVGKFPDQQKLPVHKPLLQDLIAACERFTRERRLPPVKYNIEIKSSPDTDRKYHPLPDEYADLVLLVVQEKGISSRTTLQSFDHRPLQYLYQSNAPVKLSFLDDNGRSVESLVKLLGFVPDIYSPNYRLVDKEMVNEYQKNNISLIPWTVNDNDAIKKMLRLGVAGIISDYPDRVKAALTEN